jgi:hypothetical protein
MQIRTGLEELAQSLARCFETGAPRLDFRLPAIQDPSALYDRMTEGRGQESDVRDQGSEGADALLIPDP